MKTISNVVYYLAWGVHGAVLCTGNITFKDWRFWVLTLAMGCAVLFNPTNWRE